MGKMYSRVRLGVPLGFGVGPHWGWPVRDTSVWMTISVKCSAISWRVDYGSEDLD